MSILETIQSGKESKPPRLMIYGQEGIGNQLSLLPLPTRSLFRPKMVWEKSTAKSFRLLKPMMRFWQNSQLSAMNRTIFRQ